MSDSVDLSIRQFVEGWRVFCNAAPAPAVAASDGVAFAFSAVPIAFMNAAIVTQRDVSSAHLHDLGQRACDWAGRVGVPWIFIATAEALDPDVDADAALAPCGLVRTMSITGMVADELLPPARVPAELEITEPIDDNACEEIFKVNAAAYGMPFDDGFPVWGRRAFWKDQFAAIGRIDGQPVSCAATLMVDDHRYVALVATDPERQRRGYAEAAMRHCLAAARRVHGDRPTFLHATEAGRPVYERMGYRPVATHPAYMEAKFLGGH